MYLLFIWGMMEWFWCGQHPFRGPLEGVGLENQDFMGPEMATSEASAIWAQKSGDFQGSPLPMARVMDLPSSNSLRPSSKKTDALVILCTRHIAIDGGGGGRERECVCGGGRMHCYIICGRLPAGHLSTYSSYSWVHTAAASRRCEIWQRLFRTRRFPANLIKCGGGGAGGIWGWPGLGGRCNRTLDLGGWLTE
jgi:hypothetical protein